MFGMQHSRCYVAMAFFLSVPHFEAIGLGQRLMIELRSVFSINMTSEKLLEQTDTIESAQKVQKGHIL